MAERKTSAAAETAANQSSSGAQQFTVKPTQTTSVVSGNDVLFVGEGVIRITIEKKEG